MLMHPTAHTANVLESKEPKDALADLGIDVGE